MQVRLRFIPIGIFLTLFASSCATSPKQIDTEMAPELPDGAASILREKIEEAASDIDSDFFDELENLQNAPTPSMYPGGSYPGDVSDLPIHEQVEKWIRFFSIRDRTRFQMYLNRGYAYKDVVQTILEDQGIPNELFYLAMIESGYSTHAHSKAKAVGVWQFIRATGIRYNLKANDYLDERKDPILATEAASKYLRDLYNAFQSWELALASYNCGELRVLQAIMRGDTRSYWEMGQKRLLPLETRNYIPKFMAAVLIGRDPEKFGFENPIEEDVTLYPSVEAVEVPSPVRIKDIARLSFIPEDSLQLVNPQLKKGFTPPNVKEYEIWVPKTYVMKVRSIRNQLLSKRVSLKEIRPVTKKRRRYHIVRRGENLTSIARKYKTSVSTIKSLNRLRSDRIRPGRRLRLTTRSYRRPSSTGKFYRVRRGDNLGSIAERHHIRLSKLKKWNGLRSNRIRIGQRLVIPKALTRRYRVRRGDSWQSIAKRHRTSIRYLKRINRLRRNTIFKGEYLKVPTLR